MLTTDVSRRTSSITKLVGGGKYSKKVGKNWWKITKVGGRWYKVAEVGKSIIKVGKYW